MEKSAPDIIRAYFEALSVGDESRISSFLWDDFREIDADLVTIDKPTYLDLIDGDREHNILAISAVGNIVQVKHQNGSHDSSQVRQSVFALVDDRIKLKVCV